jgi:threonine-phosphate decarboxylase
MLHGHGDDAYRYKQEIVADFSTNVWHGGAPAGLKEFLFSRWQVIERYPEVLAESLGKQIARHHQLHQEQVLISSGTTESIYLIAQAFQAKRTTITIPAFAEYEDACCLHQHQLTFVNWSDLAAVPKLDTDLCFICHPNNPTGAVLPQLEALIAANPQTCFIIDEAFIEFTISVESTIPLLEHYPHLIILRSLTKAYAIPGLRLGYIVASAAMIQQLKEIKFPWSVNAMALEAGKFIFDNYHKIQVPILQLLQEKDKLASQLQLHTPVKLQQSHTHFMLGETPYGTAAELKNFLIEGFGILIRDASNFRGLGKKHFRICTLSPAKNQLLIGAISEWKKYHS